MKKQSGLYEEDYEEEYEENEEDSLEEDEDDEDDDSFSCESNYEKEKAAWKELYDEVKNRPEWETFPISYYDDEGKPLLADRSVHDYDNDWERVLEYAVIAREIGMFEFSICLYKVLLFKDPKSRDYLDGLKKSQELLTREKYGELGEHEKAYYKSNFDKYVKLEPEYQIAIKRFKANEYPTETFEKLGDYRHAFSYKYDCKKHNQEVLEQRIEKIKKIAGITGGLLVFAAIIFLIIYNAFFV